MFSYHPVYRNSTRSSREVEAGYGYFHCKKCQTLCSVENKSFSIFLKDGVYDRNENHLVCSKCFFYEEASPLDLYLLKPKRGRENEFKDTEKILNSRRKALFFFDLVIIIIGTISVIAIISGIIITVTLSATSINLIPGVCLMVKGIALFLVTLALVWESNKHFVFWKQSILKLYSISEPEPVVKKDLRNFYRYSSFGQMVYNNPKEEEQRVSEKASLSREDDPQQRNIVILEEESIMSFEGESMVSLSGESMVSLSGESMGSSVGFNRTH